MNCCRDCSEALCRNALLVGIGGAGDVASSCMRCNRDEVGLEVPFLLELLPGRRAESGDLIRGSSMV